MRFTVSKVSRVWYSRRTGEFTRWGERLLLFIKSKLFVRLGLLTSSLFIVYKLLIVNIIVNQIILY